MITFGIFGKKLNLIMGLDHVHGCTKRPNLEIKPKYLMRAGGQLNPNTLRTENKMILLKVSE